MTYFVHPVLCYTCYKPADKCWMKKQPVKDSIFQQHQCMGFSFQNSHGIVCLVLNADIFWSAIDAKTIQSKAIMILDCIHCKLIDRCEIYISQMTMDILISMEIQSNLP